MNWKGLIPIFEWLPKYSRKLLRVDLIAGLTVCVMLVPQGMAYAMLAGMPPIYGLYGGLIPLFIYGILGTSPQLSIGPVAVSSLLILAGVSQLADPGSTEYINLVLLLGLMVGLLQMLLSFLRLGFLVSFLSHPVILGFTAAAAVIIAVSQLKYLFGFSIPRFEHVYETVFYAFSHLSQIHWPSFAICASAVLLLLFFRFLSRSLPGALLVTIIGILTVFFFNLHQLGVKIVGEVPAGVPQFTPLPLDLGTLRSLIPTILTVSIIGIVESISIAKVLEAKNRDSIIRPNQELLALGFSKIAGSFFQALPTSGSFTRSAVNDDSGAKTGMASIISALSIGLTLIFFTPIFYYLPEAVLAAIVLVAVKGLFNVKAAIHLWKVHRQDFAMMAVTFIATLVLGIEEGVLTGVLLSLGMLIFRTTNVHVAVLGKLPNSTYYRNISRFESAIQPEGILILRFDAQLYFGNVDYFKNTIRNLIAETDEDLKVLLLDASSIQDMDSSGLQALEEINDTLQADGIRLCIARVIGPVRDLLHKTKLIEKIGVENFFMNIQDAVDLIEEKSKTDEWNANAIQTNITKE